MSELTIQNAVKATIQAMSEFADADVVINDWSILDDPNANAPYVLIETADDFVSRQMTMTPETTWQIRVTLIERFEDWETTYNNLRTRRQAIIDEFNEVGANRSPGGGAVICRVIRNGSPVLPLFNPNLPPAQRGNSDPIFITQLLIMEVEEF